jgi:hypothetical protein
MKITDLELDRWELLPIEAGNLPEIREAWPRLVAKARESVGRGPRTLGGYFDSSNRSPYGFPPSAPALIPMETPCKSK